MLLNDFSPDTTSSDHQLESEKMDEIVDCILQGKYSSACLLLLESTGKDPLHYIPYRTYNRLQKQRQLAVLQAATAKDLDRRMVRDSGRSPLTDLDYVEGLSDKAPSRQGGLASSRFARSIKELWLIKTAAISQVRFRTAHSDFVQTDKTAISSASVQNLPFWHHCSDID